ncbi:MAG: NAD(P)/FAD-dependent oxidoreductase [Clostridia bacterium]|nr:NAD(P)/FAD-dependent oxidoreductase [Clostridia bacterium]
MNDQKVAVIIGAGPAGLTAAHELLKTTGIHPVIIEESAVVGGISRTVRYNGCRMDIGGHRFFSKSDRVMDWWKAVMPVQGSPSRDDLLLGRSQALADGGPDPEKQDRVMLIRSRVSRILYLRKFFDYPISMKPRTFINMGFKRTMKAGFGYIGSRIVKRPERTLEDFMINRFGTPLYRMFFEKYTEKLWGRHPSQISADWGAQRIKGLSLTKAVLAAITKPFKKKDDIDQKKQETSLIEQFLYPKYGPGQLWETVASDILAMGGEIRLGEKATAINLEGGRVKSVTVASEGKSCEIACDYLISSMPVSELVTSMRGVQVPKNVYDTAAALPYRDFITVGLLLNKLKIKNDTAIKTVNNIVPDTWIYIQEDDVGIGRLQIFNNWSPYMVRDPSKVWIGLEYFCNEGDTLWEMNDADFIGYATGELEKIGVIDKADVLDSFRERVKKAYPAYFGSYSDFGAVREYLDGFENLFCIGRNGQHRYNNMDHSMLTAFEACGCIRSGTSDKTALWSVNSEEDYQETKQE